MKKIKLLLIAFSIFALNSCEDSVEAPQTPFATFSMDSDDFGVDLGGQLTKEYTVYTANVSDAERTATISVVADLSDADPASYTVPTTVTIPAGSNAGTFSVNIQDVNIDDGKTLVLMLEQTADLFTGDNLTLSITQVCPYNDVRLNILFDGYASETSIELMDASGAVLANITQGTWADGLADYSAKWCLQSGTYTFTINDSYGDGLSWPGDGSATITLNGAVLYTVSGNFGGSASGSFTL